MKIHEYNEMMAYLTRPSYVSGGRVSFQEGSHGVEWQRSRLHKPNFEQLLKYYGWDVSKSFSDDIEKIKGGREKMQLWYETLRQKGRPPTVWELHVGGETRMNLDKIRRIVEQAGLPLEEPRGGLKRKILEAYELARHKLGRWPVDESRRWYPTTRLIADKLPEGIKNKWKDSDSLKAYIAEILNKEGKEFEHSQEMFSKGARDKAAETLRARHKRTLSPYKKEKLQLMKDIDVTGIKTTASKAVKGTGKVIHHPFQKRYGESLEKLIPTKSELNRWDDAENALTRIDAEKARLELKKPTGWERDLKKWEAVENRIIKQKSIEGITLPKLPGGKKPKLVTAKDPLYYDPKRKGMLGRMETVVGPEGEITHKAKGVSKKKTFAGLEDPLAKTDFAKVKAGTPERKRIVSKMMNMLFDVDVPEATQIKAGEALGCLKKSAASGGRIGLKAGSGLMQCISSKLDKDPQGTLAKVAKEVPETRGPIRSALGMTGKAFGKFLALAAGPLEAGFMGAAAEQGKSMTEVLATPFVLEGAARENRIRNIMGDDSYQEFLQHHRSEADPVFYGEGEATGKRLDPNLETLRSMAVAQVQQEDDARKEEARQFNLRSDETMFNQGGRVGFAKGPKDPSKRVFLKGVALASLIPVVGKYFKLAAPATKAAVAYTGPVLEGLGSKLKWVQLLAKRLWTEGDDVTKTAGTAERQIVKRGTLESGDEVDMVYDVNTKDVRFEVTPKSDPKKHSFELDTKSGAYNKEYGIDYKAPQVIDEGVDAGKKTKAEVDIVENRHVGGPEDVDFDIDFLGDDVEGAMSDLTELEAFAKKKTVKQIHKKKGTKPKDVFPDYDWDDVIDPSDYD